MINLIYRGSNLINGTYGDEFRSQFPEYVPVHNPKTDFNSLSQEERLRYVEEVTSNKPCGISFSFNCDAPKLYARTLDKEHNALGDGQWIKFEEGKTIFNDASAILLGVELKEIDGKTCIKDTSIELICLEPYKLDPKYPGNDKDLDEYILNRDTNSDKYILLSLDLVHVELFFVDMGY